MLCLIPIAGDLLTMMGQHDRSEVLFYHFRLEDQVPEHPLLRLIDEHMNSGFVRERLQNKCRSPVRTRPTPPRAARRLGWAPTTTIWWTTTIV
jgi:hypothetical protein